MKPHHFEIGVGATQELSLRVSVAILNRVVFPHPLNETLMLALERKATVVRDRENNIRVCAQPFGGVVNLLNPVPLREIVGEIQFDSEESKQEQDFRILIPPSRWEEVKKYCLRHLQNPDDAELESDPQRELVEEFEETLNVKLKPEQYTYQPEGFVIENDPVPTQQMHVRGQPTVRLYRTFEVRILDDALCRTMLIVSQRYSDQYLRRLTLKDLQNGGKGRANSIVTLPLNLVVESYLALPPDERYQRIVVENHDLDESVLAILGDIHVAQYERAGAKYNLL
jgi:hypothetical protein